mgnify:CR=1 FL=1
MKVYHFLRADDAINDLRKRGIKISTFSDLNDPFEFLNCGMSAKDIQDALKETMEEIYKKCGVICFSKNWSNTLLWSHYADKHKGICLGFEVPDDKLAAVDYISNKKALCAEFEKIIGQNSHDEEIIMNKLLLSKYKGWDYEDEVRVFAPLDEKDNNGNCFMDFSVFSGLKQVIIGVRCDKTTTEKIKECVKGYDGIEVIKAQLDFETFKIVETLEIE